MKLNPKKCTFGIEEGMFLGYKVSTRGLKVCPDKRNHYRSLKLGKKYTKKSDFHWTAEVKEAFKQMKWLIAELPMLVALMEKEKLIVYLATTKETFKVFSIKQVPRSENKKPDVLNKIASTSFTHLSKQVLVKELKEKSISKMEVLAVVEEEGDTWMTSIFKYLMDGTLPTEMKKARSVRRKSWRFAIVNGTLYKKSFLGPWLRCIGPLQPNYVIREIHEGSCSMHAGTRFIVAKALRTGYYWPTMHKEARTLIRACQDCQGIDIAGPFSEGPGKVKILIVAIDYFTKFGLLGETMENSSGMIHSRIGEGIKARLDARSKNCIEEPPHVLWAHYTMIKSNNGDTPFLLTYKTEAVISAEISMPTFRTAEVDLVQNNEALEINLDLLEEKREELAIREAKSKAKMGKYYKSKVQNTSFKPGDLVYRNNDASQAKDRGS
nr:reverse transcriptase domain-containing protein [Tanacetum cinerariifolium]